MRTFRPDVEGLRGVAVFLIVAFHAGIPGFRGGFTGVDVFFVLSGYLITGLLIREIEPADFYARRARRILPALLLMLGVTMSASMWLTPPLEQKNVAQAALATAGFASNFYFQHQAADYFAPEADANPLLHTWSLGVEEQFYFVWPLLIWLAMRGRYARLKLPATILVVGSISLGLCFWFAGRHPAWAFYGSPSRAWEFAAGALVPFAPVNKWARWLGWPGIVAILIAGVVPLSSGTNPGLAALLPVLGTAALLASGTGLPAKLLSHTIPRALGRLSYSWYLWHWPVLVLVGGRVGHLSVFAGILCAMAALGLAALTYAFVENPIRHHPYLTPRRALSLGLAAAVALIGIGTAGAWREIIVHSSQYKIFAQPINDVPRFYQFNCRSEFLEYRLHECSFGDVRSSTIVVLLGDSHAAQWFPPLERIAIERRFRLVPLIKMACPAVAIPAYQAKIGREESQCIAWRNAALQRIEQLKPTVVVAATSVEYVNRSGQPLLYRQWFEGTRATLAQLDAAGVATLLLRDTPKADFNVPLCLARAAWRGSSDCVLMRNIALDENVYRAESDAVRGMTRSRIADLSYELCDAQRCSTVQAGKIVFRDRDHLTGSFAETLAPALAEHLEPFLP